MHNLQSFEKKSWSLTPWKSWKSSSMERVTSTMISAKLSIEACMRYVGVIWLLFPIRHLYLIGVYLGEDQRTNTMKTQV